MSGETFEIFTKVFLKCLKLSELDIGIEQPLNKREKFVKFLKTFKFAMIVVINALILTSMIAYVLSHSGLLEAIIDLAHFCSIYYSIFRIISIFTQRQKIAEVLSELKELLGTKRDLKASKKFVLYQILMIASSAIMYIAILGHYITTYIRFGTTKLPFDMWIPFEYTDCRVYAAMILLSSWTSCHFINITLGLDLLFSAIVTMITIEFNDLNFEIKRLGEFDTDDDIKVLAERHIRILNLTENMKKCFCASYSFNFLQSVITISLIGFHVTVNDAVDLMIYTPYFLLTLFQIFRLCTLGQNLKDASSNTSYAAYCCDWTRFKTVARRKSILSLSTRAGKASTLKVFEFHVISLETFTAVSN